MFSYVECNCYLSWEFCSYNFLKFIGNGAQLSDFSHTSFNSLQFCWCSWDSWSLLLKSSHTAPCILDLKQGWMHGGQLCQDNCFVPLCNDGKRCNSGQDLSYWNFPRDKPKGKCTPSLEFIYLEYFVCACPALFEIQNGDCMIRVYSLPKIPSKVWTFSSFEESSEIWKEIVGPFLGSKAGWMAVETRRVS